MNTVLNIIDKDGDGKISLKELEAVGLDGLPNRPFVPMLAFLARLRERRSEVLMKVRLLSICIVEHEDSE